MKRNEWVGKLSNKNSWGNEYLAVFYVKVKVHFVWTNPVSGILYI